MGRPRKSAEERALSGLPSHSPALTASQIAPGRPKFPKHLSVEARGEFKRICKLLAERNVLTDGDVCLIGLYSECYARWVQCKTEIGSELMVVHEFLDANGMCHSARRLNPLLKVLQTAEARLQALAKELSLSPLQRDKAKPTSGVNKRDVVPGSLAESNPEMFDANGRLKIPSAEELATLDAAENGGLN